MLVVLHEDALHAVSVVWNAETMKVQLLVEIMDFFFFFSKL